MPIKQIDDTYLGKEKVIISSARQYIADIANTEYALSWYQYNKLMRLQRFVTRQEEATIAAKEKNIVEAWFGL